MDSCPDCSQAACFHVDAMLLLPPQASPACLCCQASRSTRSCPQTPCCCPLPVLKMLSCVQVLKAASAAGIPPDVELYNAALRCCTRHQHSQRAIEVSPFMGDCQ